MRRPSAMEFDGGAVRALREKNGQTQTDVADGLKALNRRLFGKVTAGSLSGWELGAKPGADVPPNLATVLGCAVSKLYRKAAA